MEMGKIMIYLQVVVILVVGEPENKRIIRQKFSCKKHPI
jgi:hypothetical protein